jgi:hypothetical protein
MAAKDCFLSGRGGRHEIAGHSALLFTLVSFSNGLRFDKIISLYFRAPFVTHAGAKLKKIFFQLA